MVSGLSASEAETDISRALREGKIRSKRAIERVTFRGHAVHPETFRRMTFEDGSRFRRRVPADLAPEDLDWENSRPRKPWPLGEGYFAHIARLELSRRDLEKVFSLRRGRRPPMRRARKLRRPTPKGSARKRRGSGGAEERAAREEASQADAKEARGAKRRRGQLSAPRAAAAPRSASKRRREPRKSELAAPKPGGAPRRSWALKAINGKYPDGVPKLRRRFRTRNLVADVIKFAKTSGLKDVGGPRHHPPSERAGANSAATASAALLLLRLLLRDVAQGSSKIIVRPNMTRSHMQVLSLDQAAYKAGVVRRTLERMLAARTGPTKVQVSKRRVGILESDLERWLNSRRRPAPGKDVA